VKPARRSTLDGWSRLRAILSGAPPQPVELFSHLQLVVLGGWLFGPWDTFASDPVLYAGMRELGTAPQWGAVGVGLGWMGIIALLFDWRPLRILAALLGFIVWLFLALAMGNATSWTSSAVPLNLTRALALAWVYVRLDRGTRL
jgi:hypothetical protein